MLTSRRLCADCTQRTNRSQKGVSGAVPMSQLHYVGILDSALAHPEHLSDLLHTSPFVKQKLPSVKNVLTEWSLHSGAGGSWNERLQRSAEAVLDAQSDTYSGEDRQGPSTLLEAYFQYFAVKGQFYAAVRNGVETIVSQYSLPNSMRTVPLVSAIQSDDEAIGDVEGEEVFSLNGIIYRLISVPATSRDLESNSSDVYLRYVTSTDAIKHKMTGNDFRASCAVQRAVSRMIASDAVNGLPICTVMETIVDYGGYRVQALCPIYLEERRTLKYGLASLEDVFICQDLPEPDSGIDYPYQKVFQQLAEKLNLRQRIVRTVVSDQPGNEDIDNVHVYESTEMLLTKDIQFHQSDDNRYYFVNFSNLMPPDVPVPESNDVLTKHFRPEFVSAFHLPLSPEALSVENLPAEGNVESNDEEAAEGNEAREIIMHNLYSLILKFVLFVRVELEEARPHAGCPSVTSKISRLRRRESRH